MYKNKKLIMVVCSVTTNKEHHATLASAIKALTAAIEKEEIPTFEEPPRLLASSRTYCNSSCR